MVEAIIFLAKLAKILGLQKVAFQGNHVCPTDVLRTDA